MDIPFGGAAQSTRKILGVGINFLLELVHWAILRVVVVVVVVKDYNGGVWGRTRL